MKKTNKQFYKNDVLTKITSKIKTYDIASFDIETTGYMNKHLITGIMHNKTYTSDKSPITKECYKYFHNRIEAQQYIQEISYKNMYIVATNLGFDFQGLYNDTNDWNNFKLIMRQGNTITAKYKNTKDTKEKIHIKYGDTMNYTPTSLKKLGEQINLPKLGYAEMMGKVPRTKGQWKWLYRYNRRDCQITKRWTENFQKIINSNILGCELKITIASCTMDLFRRKYLEKPIYKEPFNCKKLVYDSYYGGRVECFKRGKLPNKSKNVYLKDDDKYYYWYDYNCYSEDTEILTDKGFKKYNELDMKKDKCFGMKDEKLQKQRINKIFLNEYKGKLILLENENTSQLVTPNHRILYKEYDRNMKSKKYKQWSPDWKVKEAQQLPLNNYIKFPNAKIYNGHGIKISDNLLKICAWFITEGHISKYGLIEISQSLNHNPKYCKEILKLFKESKIKFKQKIRIQKGKRYLYIHFRKEYIEKYFKNIFMNSYSMRLIKDYQELTYNQKLILFKELMKGDGSIQKGKASYRSYSYELLEDIQILITMCGYKCSCNYKHHDIYIKLNRGEDSAFQKKKQFIKYNGKVWCVNTPLDNVVMRRNGKVFISKNSAYPYQMLKEYPLPSSAKRSSNTNIQTIMKYHGCSTVTVNIPYSRYPLLPYRNDDKLIFPYGKFTGSYNHIELQEAIRLYGKDCITKIHDTLYYTKTFKPFYKFVTELYALRMKYKKENNQIMVDIIKLFMNSLYGKFATKTMQDIEFFDFDKMTLSEQLSDDKRGRFDGMQVTKAENGRIRKGYSEHEKEANQNYVIPILSCTVTSYQRVQLHKDLVQLQGMYCDTDSILSEKVLPESFELGGLKIEKKITTGYLVRPKCYMIHDIKNGWNTKVKGINNMTSEKFKDILENNSINQFKFMKIKESMKQGYNVNQKKSFKKLQGVEDDKRDWKNLNFDKNRLQDSEPIYIDDTRKLYK